MDTLSAERRSENMRRIKSKDTGPEMLVRRMLHAMGYRYRLHVKGLPGTPDVVFRSRRKAIFVQGCYWHGHDDPLCKRGRPPKSNLTYWSEKLRRNQERDASNLASLSAMGWKTLVVWECSLQDREALRSILTDFMEA